MNLIQLISPYVADLRTVYGVVVALFGWAIISGYFYWLGNRRVEIAFDLARQKLEGVSDPVEFGQEYETISGEIGSDPILGERWREYSHTLVVPERSGEPIRSTGHAGEWFNLDILRSPQVGLDPRYHNVLPNLLVGAGLLFTFLGLAVALTVAGGIVEGSAEARNAELKHLLDTASFKFMTSLFGLFLSVVYTIVQKGRLRSTERAIDRFIARLDRLTPAFSPASVQREANRLLERQLDTLQTFSNDLSVNLAQAMDTTFNQRLGEHIEPLTTAIMRLSERMSSGSEETLEKMLTGFVDRLQGGAGAQVHAVAENLAGLGSQISGLQMGFSEAANRMTSSAEVMASRMSDGAEAMQTRLNSQAEASAARLSDQIEAMVSDLRDLAQSSRSTGEDALGNLASQIATAARGFEATAVRVSETLEQAAASTGGQLGQGAEAAVNRIAAATEGMRSELQAMLAEMRTALGDAGNSLRDGGLAGGSALLGGFEAAGNALAVSVGGAADRLKDAGAAAAVSLERGGDQAATLLGQAGKSFGERADDIGRQSANLAQAAAALGSRFGELDQATRNVIQPLLAASADLKLASGNARAAVDQHLRSAEVSTKAGSDVAAAAQRFETAGRQASSLVESLDEAVGRFAGVDRDLGATLLALQQGLQAFTSQIVSFVNTTDSNLSNATAQLSTLVKQLQDSIEDLVEAMPGRKG